MRKHYFQYIPSNPKKEMILTRLGYKNNVTTLCDSEKEFLNNGIKEGLILCQPQGIYCILDIIENDGSIISFENNMKIESSNLSELLKDSKKAVFMFATVGYEVSERINYEISSGDASLGVILDSAASQTADAAVGWITEFINKLLKRNQEKLTKYRYSPGYGDLSLHFQKIIFDLLELDNLGVKITDSCMLEPEKSVIAISGIERMSING
ncbi:vitamin B12 dependent-methionine synthase activation domain-containing protein [Pseudobacteroides cellulosolvens]|uniref:Vitamin B12 dependent methionine synthase activation region n=1 Tax=Pseudobacteroides cellulosolvens ATCC 35603 = DSM 2933 TaxID=398512 RepID=A0A0L6JXJ4_9FIRM|nr:vitamin B12 dependent-methionine synthase activation domain-containing protein [Pseudobacteroides cellulosolvens]KNY30285.1 Vitamin B12 dependent methionine synthase activation region [Pseudobacteroides cellulosolvens ATCC 35603 = DSM 2933]